MKEREHFLGLKKYATTIIDVTDVEMIKDNEIFTLKLHRDNRYADKHENICFAKEFRYTEMLRIVTILSHRESHTHAERSLLRCIRMMFLKLSNIEESCNLKTRTFIPDQKQSFEDQTSLQRPWGR